MSTDQYTTGKLGLIEPGAGNYVDTWDQPLYANWQTLEAAVSGTTTITLTSLNVVLTVPTFPTSVNPPVVANSAQNMRLLLTGAPTTNLSVLIPAGVGGFWIVDNRTTGSYSVTVKTTVSGSTGVAPVQNYATVLYSDGANVYYADAGAIVALVPQGTPPGIISAFGGSAAPTGWLLCDGSSYATVTYFNLFSAIGYTWGGSGANFNVPLLNNGRFLRGTGGNAGALGTYQTDQFGTHTHALTDPGHLHQVGTTVARPVTGTSAIYGTTEGVAGAQFTQSNTTGITIGSTGGNETRPINASVNYIIKT